MVSYARTIMTENKYTMDGFYDYDFEYGTSPRRSFDDLIELVSSWAIDKGLVLESNATRQMLKVVEEVGEVAGALAKGNRDDLVDAIGDSFVTLIILAKQMSIDPDYALGVAYDTIKNRTGRTENGVFIKNS